MNNKTTCCLNIQESYLTKTAKTIKWIKIKNKAF